MRAEYMIRHRPLRVIVGVWLLLTTLTLTACGVDAGPSVEFAPLGTAGGTTLIAGELAIEPGDPSSSLGFVQGKQAIAINNGGRVPLGEDRVAEVFLAPYPPDWQTDLHLFLMDSETFQPIQDIDVDLEYDMVYMDHGIDTQTGQKIGDGHYLLPLSFLMYGDWNVDMTVDLPEGRKHLRFIVKFFP